MHFVLFDSLVGDDTLLLPKILNIEFRFYFFSTHDDNRQVLKTHEPVYQAIWVDNADFDEVLISPAMIQDHMPDTVLAALNKVS